MRFGRVAIEGAAGAILAHTVAHGAGAFKKGRQLSAADVAALAAHGITSVLAARLEPGDIGEDQAAAQIAIAIALATGADRDDGGALARRHIHVAAPFTGRANVYATAAGIVTFDAGAVETVNLVDEAITVATVKSFAAVDAGEMIATVKIIPFAVPEAIVTAAAARASNARIEVHPYRPLSVGLLLTRLPATKPSVLDKRIRVTGARIEARGARLSTTRTVDHDVEAVRAGIADLTADGAGLILVFAASAIVDRADVIPAGLVAAGGIIDRLGMPVDPGNLIMIGRLGATPVIGVPSCAASPKFNGFDWVLERVLAGIPVGSVETARMGVGGLLTEIDARPQPRDRQSPAAAPLLNRRRPAIAAVVLAAGRSTRMAGAAGDRHKLLEPVAGEAMVRHAVLAALASQAAPVIVVTGHNGDAVTAALAGLDVAVVHNPNYRDGLATSVAAGVAAVGAADGALFLLADMPRVSSHVIDRLIAAYSPADDREIVVPTHGGRRGNPVLWGRRLFAELSALTGDAGGRRLLDRHPAALVEVDVGTPAIFLDIDTPEALDQLRAEIDDARQPS